jgi:hypothetical protein
MRQSFDNTLAHVRNDRQSQRGVQNRKRGILEYTFPRIRKAYFSIGLYAQFFFPMLSNNCETCRQSSMPILQSELLT